MNDRDLMLAPTDTYAWPSSSWWLLEIVPFAMFRCVQTAEQWNIGVAKA